MKHAILMTVYKDVALINRLIRLYNKDCIIYIHIDSKSSIAIEDIAVEENVHVWKKYKVNWGGLEHLRAMIFLLQQSIKSGCDYYHFVTGQDLPVNLNNADQIIEYGKSYVEYSKLPCRWFDNGALWRYQYYCFYDLFNAKKRRQERIIRTFIEWQRKIRFKRPFRRYDLLYGGSGYCTLFKADAEIVATEAPKWYGFYRFTFCAEESMIQTILLNSNRKDSIISTNLRYIDWCGTNPPKVLTLEDREKIVESKCLFARKVSLGISDSLIESLESIVTKPYND